MKCGFCSQTIGRSPFHDFLRKRSFCSQHCALRYLAILALWEEICAGEG